VWSARVFYLPSVRKPAPAPCTRVRFDTIGQMNVYRWTAKFRRAQKVRVLCARVEMVVWKRSKMSATLWGTGPYLKRRRLCIPRK